jgi:hypothetical protein
VQPLAPQEASGSEKAVQLAFNLLFLTAFCLMQFKCNLNAQQAKGHYEINTKKVCAIKSVVQLADTCSGMWPNSGPLKLKLTLCISTANVMRNRTHVLLPPKI